MDIQFLHHTGETKCQLQISCHLSALSLSYTLTHSCNNRACMAISAWHPGSVECMCIPYEFYGYYRYNQATQVKLMYKEKVTLTVSAIEVENLSYNCKKGW